ncbi:MAG: nucleoside deaminase [Thermoplasmata archaeon]|nr:nucleoside deaminase [Thermoplasmata archaeon]
MDHEKYMRMAIAKAREGISNGQTPFGACVVKNGEVISCQHNLVWEETDITSHAEIVAIREACKVLGTVDLSGCVIYSTTEPCPMCFSAIHWAKIDAIYFGTRIADAQEVGFSELTISNEEMKSQGNSPVQIFGDFMRQENKEVFMDFIAKADKRLY